LNNQLPSFALEAVRKVAPFDEAAWALLRAVMVPRRLAKNDFLVQPGQPCRHIYLVQHGLLRSFHLKEGDERNVAFAPENTFLTDLKSLRTGQPTGLFMQALEPSTVWGIAKTDLMERYQQSHQVESFGRNLLESMLEKQEEYTSWFTLYSAKERYERLVQQQPALVQRLSLGHLASYLGVRRETLSRLRARA